MYLLRVKWKSRCASLINTLGIQKILIVFSFYTLIFSSFLKFDPFDFVCAVTYLGLLFSYLVNHYVVDLRYVKQAFIYSTPGFYSSHIYAILSDLWSSSNGVPWVRKEPASDVSCAHVSQDLWLVYWSGQQHLEHLVCLPLSKEWLHLYWWELATILVWSSVEVKWSESHSLMSHCLQPHGLYSPWNSPGQNTGVGSLSLLQWIFPTQGPKSDVPHCRRILYQLSQRSVILQAN